MHLCELQFVEKSLIRMQCGLTSGTIRVTTENDSELITILLGRVALGAQRQ